MHLSLKGSMDRQPLTDRLGDRFPVLADRVIDLGNLSAETIPDKSGNGNDATLYTGRYVDLNTNESVEFDAPTAFSETPAKISQYVRSSSATNFPINWGGLTLGATMLDNDLWQQVTAEVPQALLDDESRYYFENDTAQYVAISSLTLDATVGFRVDFKIWLTSTDSVGFLGAAGDDMLQLYDYNTLSFYDETTGGGNFPNMPGLTTGVEYDCSLRCDSVGNAEFYVDDVLATSLSLGSRTLLFNRLYHARYSAFGGLMWDIKVNTLDDSDTFEHHWLGYGDTPYQDTIGTTHGTLNGSPQTVQELLREPSVIEFGLAGSDDFIGDIAAIEIKDASDVVLDTVPVNQQVGTYTSGDPCFSTGGRVGTYEGTPVGGNAEGIDPDFVGAVFEANEDKMYFDRVNDYIDLDSSISYTGDFTLTFSFIPDTLNGTIQPFLGNGNIDYIGVAKLSGRDRLYVSTLAGSTQFIFLDSNLTEEAVNDVIISRSGSTITFTVNGDVQSTTLTDSTTIPISRIGARGVGVALFKGVLTSIDFGNGTTFDGTIANGDTIGTVKGDPVTVGQKRETILQTAGEDFNKYFRASVFNLGSWDSGTYDFATGTFTGVSTTTGYASLKIPAGVTYDKVVVTLDATINSGTCRVYLSDSPTGLASIASGVEALTSGTQTIILNASASYGYLKFQALSSADLVISNIRFDLSSGNYLIPESLATAGEDALGNAIDNPRVNNEVINLFGDGEYAQIPEIGTIRSLTMAVYYAGEDITYIDKNGSVIEAYAGLIDHLYFGEGTTYSGGVVGASLNLGWNIIGITFDSNSEELGGAIINATSGSLLAYDSNKALTADEHLQNYNAFKGKYGL